MRCSVYLLFLKGSSFRSGAPVLTASQPEISPRVQVVPSLEVNTAKSPLGRSWTSRQTLLPRQHIRRGFLRGATATARLDAGAGSVIHWRRLKRGLQEGRVQDNFVWSEADELGRGSFGRVFRGKSCYDSNKSVAVKQMSRASVGDVEKLWAEIHILADLDHPNILRFLEAYEDRCNFYIVTEACLGGNLLEWLDQLKGQEALICRVAHEVTGVLAHCHSRSVCHRDLKLENILFLRRSLQSPIRVADFGLSKQCSASIVSKRLEWNKARAAAIAGGCEAERSEAEPKRRGSAQSKGGEATVCRTPNPSLVRMRSVAGTPEYMAPEVISILNRRVANPEKPLDANHFPDFYDLRCDIWSLGVCVYTLLHGELPYDMEAMSAFVAEGVALPALTPSPALANGFIDSCLTADFQLRPAAKRLLSHRWFECLGANAGPTPHSTSTIASRLRAFSKLSRFKRAALLAAARNLGSYEHEELRRIFQKVDIHNTGEVQLTDLMEYLAFAPSSPTTGHQWVAEAVRIVDAECKGTVAYTEFLAAIMDHNIEERKDLALAAFRGFDIDGDGTVTAKEMERVIENCDAALGDVLLEGAELDFDDFMGLLKSG